MVTRNECQPFMRINLATKVQNFPEGFINMIATIHSVHCIALQTFAPDRAGPKSISLWMVMKADASRKPSFLFQSDCRNS